MFYNDGTSRRLSNLNSFITPFAVHLRKMYIHLRQQLKLYGKYTFISTSMKLMNANELSITLFPYVITFNSINGWTIAPLNNETHERERTFNNAISICNNIQ